MAGTWTLRRERGLREGEEGSEVGREGEREGEGGREGGRKGGGKGGRERGREGFTFHHTTLASSHAHLSATSILSPSVACGFPDGLVRRRRAR